jgi:hypothetical protein
VGHFVFQRHYQYRVVQISNDVLHCDFVELFYAQANTNLLASDIVLKMRCTYNGTYLLRASNSDTTPVTGQQPSTSMSHLPHQLSASSSTSITTPNPSHLTPAVGRGSLSHVFRPLPYRQASLLPPTNNRSTSNDFHRPRDDDTDSDDSRQASVKRLKDSQVEVEGKTYRVQGKTSVYSIIIAFTSMCTLMDDGHIDKLLAGCGNYVNNYTSEIQMKGILRQTLVSTTLSGMQLHAPQNFTLFRFDLPQFHDKVFQFQWTYPDTWMPDDLHPIHFLSINTLKLLHFDHHPI